MNEMRTGVMQNNHENSTEAIQEPTKGIMHTYDNFVTVQSKLPSLDHPLDLTLSKSTSSQQTDTHREKNTPVLESVASQNCNSKVAVDKQFRKYSARKGNGYFNEQEQTNLISQTKFLNNLGLILNPTIFGKTASDEGVVIKNKSKPKQRNRSVHPLLTDVGDNKSPCSRLSHAASNIRNSRPTEGERFQMPIRSNDDPDTRVNTMQVNPPVINPSFSKKIKLTLNNIHRLNGSATGERTEKQHVIKEWLATVPDKPKVDNNKNEPTLAVYRQVSKHSNNCTACGDQVVQPHGSSIAIGPQLADMHWKAIGIPHSTDDSTNYSMPGESQNQPKFHDKNDSDHDYLCGKCYERRRKQQKPRKIAYLPKDVIGKNKREHRIISNVSRDLDTNQRRSTRLREKATKYTTTTSRNGNRRSSHAPSHSTTGNEYPQRKMTECVPDTKKNHVNSEHSAEVRHDANNEISHKDHTKRRQTTRSKHQISRDKKHKQSTKKDDNPPVNEEVQKSTTDCFIL